MVKIPRYIKQELEKASDYVNKSSDCISKFEEWVLKNVGDDFDFGLLRAGVENIIISTESLSEIEYGHYNSDIDISNIERVLNIWVKENQNII